MALTQTKRNIPNFVDVDNRSTKNYLKTRMVIVIPMITMTNRVLKQCNEKKPKTSNHIRVFGLSLDTLIKHIITDMAEAADNGCPKNVDERKSLMSLIIEVALNK